MKNEIKVSIIVAVYNASNYLDKCLTSILKQSLKEIEIICIDDGSTDSSLEILQKYSKKDERFKVISQSNMGASAARNRGLEKAKGEYFIVIDSDDWIEEEYLEKMYERAKENELDIVICDMKFKFNDSKKDYILKDFEVEENEIYSSDYYYKRFIRDNFYGYLLNKLIKLNVIKENKLFYNEKIFMWEDLNFLLKIIFYSKRIGKINKAYYNYRKCENNSSGYIKLKNLLDIEEGFNDLSEFYIKNKEIEKAEEIERRKYLELFRLLGTGNYNKVENIEVLKRRLCYEVQKKILNLNL